MTDELDVRLSNPLPEIADCGFSTRVVKHIAAEHLRHVRIEAGVTIAGVAAVLGVLPFTDLGRAITQAADTMGTSVSIAAAFAALVLSAVLAEAVRE